MLKERGTMCCAEYDVARPSLWRRGSVFLLFATFFFVVISTFSTAGTVSATVKERNAENVVVSAIRETYRKKALDLWKQAAELQISGRYEKALEKYREGLGYSEDPRVREHVWKLEETLAERRGRESEKERAARGEAAELWKEAAALQQAGWFEDALRKYREGLELSDDPRVREHVKKLEAYVERLRLRGLLPLLVFKPEILERSLKTPSEGVFFMWYSEKIKSGSCDASTCGVVLCA